MLTIENLQVKIGEKVALAGLNLTVQPGTVHAIMGPNGSGKSTLAAVLAGKPGYEVVSGSVTFQGQDLLALSPEDRAAMGIFLAFQHPIEIPGVSNTHFLQTAINQIRKKRNLEPLDAVNFLRLLKEKAALVHIDAGLLHRALNEGFSGGEKKKNEILQMALLDPTLAILDEIDSGLDIDALKNVATGINQLRKPTHAIMLITHYQRLLDLVIPDVVHVLYKGKIVQSGTAALVKELEAKGYDWLNENSI